MPMPVTCGHCGKTMQVPERMAGKRGKCPGCGHLVEIPAPEPSAPPPGAPPAPDPGAPRLNVRRLPERSTACREHNGRPVSVCGECGQPICIECRKSRGYFCSDACRDAARARKPTEAEEELKAVEKALVVKADALMSRARKVTLAAAGAAALLAALWIVLALRGIEAWEARDPVHAYVSAVGSGDGVYAVTSVGKIVSLDPRSGKVLWSADPPAGGRAGGDALEGLFGAWVTLRPQGGRLLCVGAGALAALDPATGRVLWRRDAGPSAGFSPRGEVDDGLALADGTLFVPAGGRAVAALDPATGRPRWTATLEGVEPSVVAAAGASVFAAGRPASVVALSAKDGAVAWTWTGDAAFAEGAPLGLERLLPHAGGVIAATARRAVCLDASGKPRWTVEAGRYEDELHGVVLAAAAGRVFYAGHFEGLLVDPATGKEAWRTKLGNGVRLEWTDGATLLVTADGPGGPALQKVEGGAVGTIRYAGTLQGGMPTGMGRTLAAVDAATGKTRWSAPAGRDVAVRDGVAYTAGSQGKVALLQTPDRMFSSALVATSVDIATGQVRWQWERASASATPVATTRHLLLVGSAPGEGKNDAPAGFVLALDR